MRTKIELCLRRSDGARVVQTRSSTRQEQHREIDLRRLSLGRRSAERFFRSPLQPDEA